LVVLHTAQGADDYRDLGAYFQGDVGVSSHVGIDDTPGEVGEYVARGGAAWTAAAYNSTAVQAELCAWAEWTAAQWHNEHAQMIANAAAWVGEECAAFGIPLVALNAAQAQGGASGVCDHAALGADGGGHWDIGHGLTVAEVVAMAAGGAPTTPSPVPPVGVPFPYPPGHYLGQPDPDPYCHSGYYGGVDHTNVATWQAGAIALGYSVGATGADGYYGPSSEAAARLLQVDAGLTVDGLVGVDTWGATFG
jgi:hypothetical protein